MGIGCGIQVREGNSHERVNTQRKITALGNETATSIQCLLFKYGITKNKRMGVEYPITLSIFFSASLWRSSLFRTPRQFFPRLWRGRGECTWRNTIAVYFKISEVLPESKLSSITKDHAERNFWPHQNLQLTNNTAGPFLEVHNSGFFWMTRESERISLTAKKFWAVLHNTRWTQCF